MLKRLDPRGNWTQQFASADATGAVVYEYVPAGTYEFSSRYRGEQIRIRAEVPADRVIPLN